MKTVKKNYQKGFSILQVVIAGSMMSVMGLVSASMISQQVGSTSFLEDKLSRVDMEREFIDFLSNSTMCESSFQGTVPPAQFQKGITLKKSATENFLTANMKKDQLQVAAISIRNIDLTPPATTGQFEIRIDINRTRKAGGPVELRPLTKQVHATIDGAGRITSCNIDKHNISTLTGVSGLECTTVRRDFSPRSSNKVARCPATYQITGCTAGCRGNSTDTDTRISSSENACYSDDKLCSGSRPRVIIHANCCRLVR